MDQLADSGHDGDAGGLAGGRAYWLAPALVTFEQASAAEAMWRKPALHVAQSGRIWPCIRQAWRYLDAGRTADSWRGIHCGGAARPCCHRACLLSGFGRPRRLCRLTTPAGMRTRRPARLPGSRLAPRRVPLSAEGLQQGQQAGQVVGDAGLACFFGASSHGVHAADPHHRPGWRRPGPGCSVVAGRHGILEQDASGMSHALVDQSPAAMAGASASTLTLVWVTSVICEFTAVGNAIC